MNGVLRLAATMLLLWGASGCGDDSITISTTTHATTTTQASTTSQTSTVPSTFEQLAVWPAPGMIMTSPEDAARDFVEQALGVPAVLGPFQQGDQRSGEIEVFVSTDSENSPRRWLRGVLFLRQLGPSDAWFVLGGASEHVTIERPASGGEVPAGPLVVQGRGRGFEATLVVTAFLPGRSEPLDLAVTFGGGLDVARPYEAELDLSSVAPGTVIGVMTRGGVGLETDPGEFAVLPVLVQS